MMKLMEKLMESQTGAECLIEAMKDICGAQDFVWCIFDVFCEEDQKRFVELAADKYELAMN